MELTLAHQLVLLSLDERTGARRQRQGVAFGVCGAALADLALAGRIGLDAKRVVVLDSGATPQPLLNDVLATVAAARPARPRTWCYKLQRVVRVQGVLDDLVRLGYVRRERARWAGLIPVTRYPVLATGIVAALRGGLTNVVALGASPTSDADGQLARLLLEGGLRTATFGATPRRVVRGRIAAIDTLRWPGDGVRQALAAARSAAAG